MNWLWLVSYFFGGVFAANAILLLAHVGAFHPRAISHILALGLGVLLMGINLARHFGQFHGGNTPTHA